MFVREETEEMADMNEMVVMAMTVDGGSGGGDSVMRSTFSRDPCSSMDGGKGHVMVECIGMRRTMTPCVL